MMTYEMIAALYSIEKDHKGSKAIYQITLERGVVLTIVIGDREDMTEVFNKYIKPRKVEPIDIIPYSYRVPDEAVKERLKDLDFKSMYSSLVMFDSKDMLTYKKSVSSDEEEE